MPIAKTYLPKQWTDWTTWLLGIWLCLSPWTLFFEFEAPAVKNAVLLGALNHFGRVGRIIGVSRLARMDQCRTWNVAHRVNMGVGHRDTGSEDKFYARWCAGRSTSPL